ncbi:hypothetical protein Tco_1281387 [Tanacetum coccineum]
MISKEDSGSKMDLEKIQESGDEETIVNTDTQQEVVTPVKPDDISLPIRKTSGRVSKPPQFYYGFHIEEEKISDSTLSELDEPTNYKEAMASPEASFIPLGQKNTLDEYMILSGADNRPPMLDKDLYDSWKIRMELYMQNREHGRMILESVENGLLIWPTVDQNKEIC